MFPLSALISIVIFLVAVIVHEVAHGWTANKLGDPTAKLEGRLTLDPTKHLDPFGSILVPGMLIITGAPILFGWAKPVPYNPYNLKNPRRDEALIAAAGPASNILLAIIGGMFYRLLTAVGVAGGLLPEVLMLFVMINLILAIFNLIPIPPLDGSKILFSILPSSFDELRLNLEHFGFMILILFLFVFREQFWSVITPILESLTALFTGVHF